MSSSKSPVKSNVTKRKHSSKETSPPQNDDQLPEKEEKVKPGDKFGPLPRIPNQRAWTRGIMIVGVFAVVYFTARDKKEIPFARHRDTLSLRAHDIPCSESYKAEMEEYPGCVPSRCGRVVSDTLVTASEADSLLRLARRGLALGSQGAAAILDLHSGALSFNDSFVNIYKLEEARGLFQPADFDLYKLVKSKIQQAVSHHFQVESGRLFLTHPTFFSRLTAHPARTVHDHYWLPHVDKETYQSFHFTSLLYLNDFGADFQGGRFVFVDDDHVNRTVEPKKGRVSMFTSGAENLHLVERVTRGTRFAITVSFTCDERHAVADPRSPSG